MDQLETNRWNCAADLLERVLDLPREEQERAAAELGRTHGVLEELESLLTASRSTSVLDSSLEDVLQQMPASAPAPNALRGQLFGQWLLGDEIGRGGMSIVYQASRTGQDFEQHAALKILWVDHLGEDFVDSFLRERQILSDLQHPNIGSLIDGGLTPDGAPFLVMPHVKGEPIDRWCEQQDADLETIARLMLQLCHTVAYAQRPLVVHQDIKPANVLIDEHRQPVLIDFGIASLLGQAARARTPRAFTPQYAAPEQRLGGAITTATDVYALGALFGTLLAGHRVDRDLNAILQAATQEDPERRYANARNLANDIQAWLEVRPVQAQPSSLRYRAGRFIARNRWGVAAATLVLASLVGGLGAALWQARVASGERDLARAESARATQATEFLKDLFSASDPDRSGGEEISARELLDQGAHQVRSAFGGTPDLKAEMLVLLGDLYRELGQLAAAEPLLTEALALAETLQDHRLRVEALRGLALVRMEAGAHEVALALVEQAEAMLLEAGEVPGRRHAALMEPILFSLAELGRPAEAAERGEAALGLARGRPDIGSAALYAYLYSVANVMLIAERVEDAERLLLEASAMEFEGAGDPTTRIALHSNLASIFDRKGDLAVSLAHRREALAITERIYPPVHVERARKLSNLASVLNELGNHHAAEDALREALDIYDRKYAGTAHPRVAAAHNNLGRALAEGGRNAEAEPHLSMARDLALELFGAEDPRYIVATGNLGDLQRRLGNLERAEELLMENLQLRRSVLGPEHSGVSISLSLLAALRLQQGRWADALALTDEALALSARIGYENPRYVIATQTRRARALGGLGRDSEAEDAFTEALRDAEAAGVDAGTTWPELLAARAEYLAERGDPTAQAALQTALAAHREVLGAGHPATLQIAQRALEASPPVSE